MQRIRIILALVFALPLSGCLVVQPVPTQEEMMARMEAQQRQNNQAALTNIHDNLRRTYKDMMDRLAGLDASVVGFDQSLTPAARQDPEYAVAQQRHQRVRADIWAIKTRYQQLSAWADAHRGPLPTAELQGFTQGATSIQQDLAAAMSVYGNLQTAMYAVKARHP